MGRYPPTSQNRKAIECGRLHLLVLAVLVFLLCRSCLISPFAYIIIIMPATSLKLHNMVADKPHSMFPASPFSMETPGVSMS